MTNVPEKSKKDVSKKLVKFVSKKPTPSGYEKEVENVVKVEVTETSIPKLVVRKSKRLKTKSNSSGGVNQDVTKDDVLKNKKIKSIGILKRIKKIRTLNDEEPATKASSPSKMLKLIELVKTQNMISFAMMVHILLFHLERLPMMNRILRRYVFLISL